jgi:fused signal recognition particle receptor
MDATTGQNGLSQAKQFTDAVGVTGIVLTKLDGTAKGGIVFSITKELGIPVKYIGLGEKIDDLDVENRRNLLESRNRRIGISVFKL